jgi:rubrerythrin
MKKLVIAMAAVAITGLFVTGLVRAAEVQGQATVKVEESVTVVGEVLDMACYLDHGAQGENHTSCAKTCIESGLPVGIKDKEGKVYLVIGEHKPLNKELAPLAAKTITIRGKLVTRDGISMIENAEIIGSATTAKPAADMKYTCPMCGGAFDKPGKCPKCGMNLVEKK